MAAPKHKEGELGFYAGGSRMGKTAALKQRIARHRRVIVWSVKEPIDQYAATWAGAVVVASRAALIAEIRRLGKGRGHIVYTPPIGNLREEFSFWARAAFAWGKAAPCTIVAEELADVSSPGKAPPGWGEVCRQALGWGCNVYAISQRPAESDKTAIGNATFIHTHFMVTARDRAYMAQEMGVTAAEIQALEKLEWIQSWASGKEIKRGKVRFPRIQRGVSRKRAAS